MTAKKKSRELTGKKKPAKAGRPSGYSDKLADTICHLLVEHSLIAVCKKLKIGYSSVMLWLEAHPEFLEKYTRARSFQADFKFDEVTEISRSKLPADEKRVRIDANKWTTAHLKPKKYGYSTQIKHADADGGKLSLCTILAEINGRTAGLPGAEEESRQSDVAAQQPVLHQG